MESQSSSLMLRRKKTVSEISCNPVRAANKHNSRPSLASHMLEVMSPLVGVASRAIKKIKKRNSCPDNTSYAAALQQPACIDMESSFARGAFLRLVYKKARSLREERNARQGTIISSYTGLREVAIDIKHSVRICLHVKRFIELAKTMSEERIEDTVPTCTDFVVEPTNEICKPAEEEVQEKDEEEGADENWNDLMADLSPITPQVKAPLPCARIEAMEGIIIQPPKTQRKKLANGKALRSNSRRFVKLQAPENPENRIAVKP